MVFGEFKQRFKGLLPPGNQPSKDADLKQVKVAHFYTISVMLAENLFYIRYFYKTFSDKCLSIFLSFVSGIL